MIRHADSHVDHDLTEVQLRHLLERFADRGGFFIETIELPLDLGTLPCGLFGPSMDDSPIGEDEVSYARRGARAWPSRLVDRPARQTRQVTVIAGPHEETCPQCESGLRMSLAIPEGSSSASFYRCSTCKGTGKIQHDCILFTAFGGPPAPQEPGDTACKDPAASAAFWREHALVK